MADPTDRPPIAAPSGSPSWMDGSIWSALDLHRGDIIVATYPRSGTTWVQQILARLIFQGETRDIDISSASMWMEGPYPMGAKLSWASALPHRRFFKSHLSLDLLPDDDRLSVVNVVRDLREVLLSHYDIFYLPMVRRFGVTDVLSARHYFLRWLTDEKTHAPAFHHVRSGWDRRARANVCLAHYSNLQKDLASQMRRLADFLSIPIDEALWDDTVRRCTFSYMKANAPRLLAAEGDKVQGLVDHLISKGQGGRWRDVLTPDDSERYVALLRAEVGEECAHWVTTGDRP